MTRGELRLRENAQGDFHTITLAGELDLGTAPELQATIVRLCMDGAREVVLDLHELSFIDSTGLRVILSGSELCESHGCEFSLTRVQPPAQRLFELTGVVGQLQFRGRALAKRLARRRRPDAESKAPVDGFRPDFEVSLDLDPSAPRSARNYVRDVVRERSSPELREAVMLLTSELATRTVLQCTSDGGDSVELRVWLRTHVVRVELRVLNDVLLVPPKGSGPKYDHMLLDEMADRWATDTSEDLASVWFEIDRDDSRAKHASNTA